MKLWPSEALIESWFPRCARGQSGFCVRGSNDERAALLAATGVPFADPCERIGDARRAGEIILRGLRDQLVISP